MEQQFAQLKRSPVEQASSHVDTDRRVAIVIGSCFGPEEVQTVVSKARALYGQLLGSGKARSVHKTRIDAGTCGRTTTKTKASEKHFARTRSAAIRKVTSETELVTPPRQPRQDLPDSVQKEVKKQESQALKRKAEAYLDGLLLDKEATPEVLAAAGHQVKADGANDKTRRKQFLSVSASLKRQAKQTRVWALANLPSPAFFLGASEVEKGRWTRLLAAAGVSHVTDASRR